MGQKLWLLISNINLHGLQDVDKQEDRVHQGADGAGQHLPHRAVPHVGRVHLHHGARELKHGKTASKEIHQGETHNSSATEPSKT